MNARYQDARARDDTPPEDDSVAAEIPPVGDVGPAPGLRAVAEAARRATDGTSGVDHRLSRLERQNRWLKLGFAMLLLLLVGLYFGGNISPSSIVKETLTESRELKLVDSDGNARLFLRMYSRVPVLQILDKNGKPRMSLGLRFDDTPFFDLSDRSGRTRVSLEMTSEDQPKLELFDEHGNTKFKIN